MKTEEVNTLKEKNKKFQDELDKYMDPNHEWFHPQRYGEPPIFTLGGIIEGLYGENKKLQDIIDELNCEKEKIIKDLSDRVDYGFKEIEKYKTSNMCNGAILDYAGNYAEIEDMKEFNDWLKEQTFLAKNYSEENYKKMYDWFDMEELLKDE